MKKITFLFVAGFLFMMLAACGTNNSNDGNNAKDNENDTINVNHELGKTEVKKNPKNVVVFNFGILDTLDELGLDDNISATVKDSLPSYLDKFDSDDYEDVGDIFEPDFEKISEIDPDLIIISGRQTDIYDELSKIAPTVYLDTDNEHYMDSFKENMETIGEIFDKEDEIDQKMADLDKKVDEVNDKAEDLDKEGLTILSTDKDVSAYGPKGRFGGLIHDTLGVPPVDNGIESSTHGQEITFEYVKKQDPDLLYVIDRGAAIDEGDTSSKELVENELTEDTKAYKNDNITYLNPDIWYLSGGGLVSMNEMVDEISESLD